MIVIIDSAPIYHLHIVAALMVLNMAMKAGQIQKRKIWEKNEFFAKDSMSAHRQTAILKKQVHNRYYCQHYLKLPINFFLSASVADVKVAEETVEPDNNS